jgi:hypothetical protein
MDAETFAESRPPAPARKRAGRNSVRLRALRIITATMLLTALIVIAVAVAMKSGDPTLFPVKSGEHTIAIYVVSHGYHSGLALRYDDLVHEVRARQLPALNEVLDRFQAGEYLEFGWGDEGFYRNVRTISDLKFVEALRALFAPGNASVMHVVALREEPRSLFPFADIVRDHLVGPGFSAPRRSARSKLRAGRTYACRGNGCRSLRTQPLLSRSGNLQPIERLQPLGGAAPRRSGRADQSSSRDLAAGLAARPLLARESSGGALTGKT